MTAKQYTCSRNWRRSSGRFESQRDAARNNAHRAKRTSRKVAFLRFFGVALKQHFALLPGQLRDDLLAKGFDELLLVAPDIVDVNLIEA